MDRHDRLKMARERKGLKTAADAARALGVPYGTYSGHESGSRGIKDDDIVRYAKAFRVSPGWLAFGTGEAGSRAVGVIGYVGAGTEVYFVDDHALGAALDEIEVPADVAESAVAVKVRGDSMFPVYHDGDVIVYDRVYEGKAIRDVVGLECVVRAADGRTFIKRIERGSTPGAWTLFSHNAATMPDVVLEWAAPVSWVRKKHAAR